MDTLAMEEVRAIARLSRLALTEEEVAQATSDLSGILGHFSAIGGIDTANIQPADDASGLVNVSREDVAHPNALCSSEDLLERSPKIRQKYIEVPGVFDESSIS